MTAAKHKRLLAHKIQVLDQMIKHHMGNSAYQNQGKCHDK